MIIQSCGRLPRRKSYPCTVHDDDVGGDPPSLEAPVRQEVRCPRLEK